MSIQLDTGMAMVFGYSDLDLTLVLCLVYALGVGWSLSREVGVAMDGALGILRLVL